MNTTCCVCAILIAGRKPQFMKCVSCHHFYHRQCSATSISSFEYVRKKKANEAFNGRCVNCVGGVVSFTAVMAVVDPPEPEGHSFEEPTDLSLPKFDSDVSFQPLIQEVSYSASLPWTLAMPSTKFI